MKHGPFFWFAAILALCIGEQAPAQSRLSFAASLSEALTLDLDGDLRSQVSVRCAFPDAGTTLRGILSDRSRLEDPSSGLRAASFSLMHEPSASGILLGRLDWTALSQRLEAPLKRAIAPASRRPLSRLNLQEDPIGSYPGVGLSLGLDMGGGSLLQTALSHDERGLVAAAQLLTARTGPRFQLELLHARLSPATGAEDGWFKADRALPPDRCSLFAGGMLMAGDRLMLATDWALSTPEYGSPGYCASAALEWLHGSRAVGMEALIVRGPFIGTLAEVQAPGIQIEAHARSPIGPSWKIGLDADCASPSDSFQVQAWDIDGTLSRQPDRGFRLHRLSLHLEGDRLEERMSGKLAASVGSRMLDFDASAGACFESARNAQLLSGTALLRGNLNVLNFQASLGITGEYIPGDVDLELSLMLRHTSRLGRFALDADLYPETWHWKLELAWRSIQRWK